MSQDPLQQSPSTLQAAPLTTHAEQDAPQTVAWAEADGGKDCGPEPSEQVRTEKPVKPPLAEPVMAGPHLPASAAEALLMSAAQMTSLTTWGTARPPTATHPGQLTVYFTTHTNGRRLGPVHSVWTPVGAPPLA